MGKIIPVSKPALPIEEVDRLLAAHHVTPAVALLGVRGYRARTMGGPGNDTGLYDDAIFLRFPGGMLPWNANADPSRLGWNAALGKPFAQLKTGVWPFIRGKHKQRYDALRQPYDDEPAQLRGLADYWTNRDNLLRALPRSRENREIPQPPAHPHRHTV